MKILVVEDNPIDSKILQERLSTRGFEVICMPDGTEAIASIKSEKPDAVLLDLSLPTGDVFGHSWDGFSILAWMRLQPRADQAPVIVLTGSGPEVEQKVLSLGAKAYFQKPVELDDLVESIKSAIAQRVPKPQ